MDEHVERVNEIVFPTPTRLLGISRRKFPNSQTSEDDQKLEATGQILGAEYKRGDYKIKFISCNHDH